MREGGVMSEVTSARTAPKAADTARIAAVEETLRRQIHSSNVKAIVAAIAGMPLCLLAPLVLGTTLWMAVLFGLGKWTPWWWWFGGVAVLGIPSLFRLELRTRGEYLQGALADADHSAEAMPPLLSIGATNAYAIHAISTVMMQPSVAAAGFVEFFLSGPRLVLYALRRRRDRSAEKDVDIRRAAEVVALMLTRVGGLEPVALLRPGERMPKLVPILQWLAANALIGVTETGSTVYLFTEARKRLEPSMD